MGWECVDPASVVHLRRPVGTTFIHLFVRANHFETAGGRLDQPAGDG
jgi:hypothetical protein